MKRSISRRLVGAGVGLALTAALAACQPTNDGTPQTITVVGSDTTQDFMGALSAFTNGDTNFNPDPDRMVNILSQQTTPKTAPGDSDCGSRTYHTPPAAGEFNAPNGSSAGRDALKFSANSGDGCVDIARSSAGPRGVPADNSTFEYYAYALDAVGVSSASANAPGNLSLAQVRGIYNCTFTNWNQVGGTTQQIQRYYPQAGSGTRAFFQSDVLGFDPTTISGPGCPATKLTQENSGQGIAFSGDQATAIVPYSAANFVAQSRGTAPDQRAGQTIRSINLQSPIRFVNGQAELNTAPGPVTENNVRLNNPTPAYPGVRYVFNVVDRSSVRYEQARRLIGFTNQQSGAHLSKLCNGTFAGLLTNYGFGPLNNTSSSRNLPGSTCRLYTN